MVSILSTFVKRRNKITEYDCEDKIKKREAELQVIIDDLLRRQQDCEDNIKIKEAEHIETINEYTRRLRECDENIVKLNDDHERDLRHNVDMLNANIRATKTDLDTLRERYTEINNRYKEELQGHRLSDQQLEAMRKQTDEFRVQLDKKDTDYRELNEQLVTALGDAEAATKAKDEAVRSAKEATEERMRESASEVDRKRDSYYKVVSVLSKFINIKKEEAAAEEREREIAEINNAFERERQDLEAGRKLMEAELKEQHEADKIEAINQARLEEVANAEVVAKAAAEEKEKELDGIKQRLLTVRNKAKKYGVILTSMKGELQKKQEDLEALNISKVEAAEKAEAIIRERQEELDAAAGGLRASEEAHKRIREEQEVVLRERQEEFNRDIAAKERDIAEKNAEIEATKREKAETDEMFRDLIESYRLAGEENRALVERLNKMRGEFEEQTRRNEEANNAAEKRRKSKMEIISKVLKETQEKHTKLKELSKKALNRLDTLKAGFIIQKKELEDQKKDIQERLEITNKESGERIDDLEAELEEVNAEANKYMRELNEDRRIRRLEEVGTYEPPDGSNTIGTIKIEDPNTTDDDKRFTTTKYIMMKEEKGEDPKTDVFSQMFNPRQ